MSIFSRKSTQNSNITQRAQNSQETNENNESFTVPVGLDFLMPFLSKGEATALSAFFGGIQLISSTIASIPIHVKDIASGDLITDHPILSALKGSQLSKFNLMKQLVWDLYVSGNAILYIKRLYDGTPKELVYCPSGTYTIVYNEVDKKLYYLINSITTKKIEPINVIHLVMNSRDGVNGKAIALYAKNLIDISLATDRHAKNYFENGANIDGILKSNKPLSSNQKMDIKQSWQQVHGAGKSGGIAVVGNDMDYIPIGSNANDSEMLETREFNAQEVCRYLSIDPLLLGITSSAAYNSLEQAQLSFLSHCIYPLISLIEDEFNRKLLKPSEKKTLIIDFDEAHIMFADKAATANYYSTLVKNGIISINEARHFLDLPPKEGADELIIAFTDINQNKVSGDTGTNTENKEDEQK